MKTWIFAVLSLALFGAGCTQRSELPVMRQLNTVLDSTASSDALIGLNKARVKVSNQMGFCPSAVIKISTYKNTDDLKQVAFSLLRQRNPNITMEDLEVDTTPFMNFSTNPPTPSKGETLRTLLRPDGSIESYSVESSQTTKVRIGADFYNRSNRTGIDLNCLGHRPIDDTCLGPLEFTKGDVLLEVAYAC